MASQLRYTAFLPPTDFALVFGMLYSDICMRTVLVTSVQTARYGLLC